MPSLMTDQKLMYSLSLPFLFQFAAKPQHALVFYLIFKLGATFSEIKRHELIWLEYEKLCFPVFLWVFVLKVIGWISSHYCSSCKCPWPHQYFCLLLLHQSYFKVTWLCTQDSFRTGILLKVSGQQQFFSVLLVTQMIIFNQGILLLGSKPFLIYREYSICKHLELNLVRKGLYKL